MMKIISIKGDNDYSVNFVEDEINAKNDDAEDIEFEIQCLNQNNNNFTDQTNSKTNYANKKFPNDTDTGGVEFQTKEVKEETCKKNLQFLDSEKCSFISYTRLKKIYIDEVTPPENFGLVIKNVYRSSFPQPNNINFLKKLNLKSMLCLIPEEYPPAQMEMLKNEKIKLVQLGMSGNKEPFVNISSTLITEAIKIVIDPANHPILIHCNRGKHRTGCLVGVLRRLQKWSSSIIFDEYRKFASPKERAMDQQFIELYDETSIVNYAQKNNLLPLKWD